ncbi:MAG: hypothetical protein E7476_12045 [Ruminococcaceae bacterium]|nr:hypothetical protein [Oscillospiraceae bacterium]
MTIEQMAKALGYEMIGESSAFSREIESVYCCDLLSFVMGRAPAGSAWVTVMGNVNAVAVARLADVACVVFAEGVRPDQDAIEKAGQNEVALLCSPAPVFDTARAIAEAAGL